MDNLSHSVAGLVAGEFIHRLLPQEKDASNHALRRRLFLVTCAFASNFPDLDLVFTSLLPAPLGYLLHHRGHTHTLLYALPQAALLAALLCLLWPGARRLIRESRSARTGFILTLVSGFVLHLSMDYLNSYGIHPFHPFDSEWHYGDMVFILEPVFWVALGTALALTLASRLLRIFFIAILLGLPLVFTFKAYLAWYSWTVLAAMAGTIIIAGMHAGRRKLAGLSTAAGLVSVFLFAQMFASHEARQVLTQILQQNDPANRVLDISLTAFPSNPVCWTYASVESNEGRDRFYLKRGVISVAPGVVATADCPAALNEARDVRNDAGNVILAEHEGQISRLRELQQDNCFFDAWLRFARMPAVDALAATDIRFASTPRGNFTSLTLSDFKDRACPAHVPGWTPPRADLLKGIAKGSGESDAR